MMEDIEGLKERILSKKNQHDKNEFQAGVGLSRSWDPEDAGEEVIVSALENLSKKPKFVLLFSTIHYAKERKGMKRFVNAAYDSLPEGTPLIGGTVAGFINNYGCFTRGATALAVYYPNMDVAIGIGRNTKRAPHLAAKQCAEMILKNQKQKYPTNFLLNIIAGPTKPIFFGFGSHWVVKHSIMAKIGPKFLELSVKYRQKGQGLEDDIIKYLADYMKDYIIIGASSGDNNELITNYQFVDKHVEKFSLVAMGLNTDLKIDFSHTDGLYPTGIKFKVTKTAQGSRIVKELDGKPAARTFFERIGIPMDSLNDRILRTTFFLPVCFRTNDGYMCPNAIGCVLKDYLAFNYSIKGTEIELFTTSGKDLIKAVSDAIESLKITKPKVGIIVSCLARLETLGVNIYKVRDLLLRYFNSVPFLLVYSAGENIKFPNKEPHHFNETFNILVATNEN